jgi:ribosomal protein L29
MQQELDTEALKAELASLEAMLADLESGKIPEGLGNPFENRQADIRRRIDQIKSKIRGKNAPRS